MVRFDVKQTIEKSKVSDDKEATDQLKKLLTAGAGAKLGNKVKEIIDSPEKLGLDLREPLLFFMNDITDRIPEVGLAGMVYDKGSFTECLNTAAKELNLGKVTEEKEVSYLVSNEVGIFYTDEYFYITYVPGNEVDDIIELMINGVSNSMEGSEKMKKLCSYDGIMQVMINYEAMADIARMKNTPFDAGIDYSKIDMYVDYACEKGELIVTGEIVSDDKVYNEMLEKNKEFISTINSDLYEYVPAESAALLFSINGEKLWDVCKDNNVLDIIGKDAAKELSPVVESVAGDVVMSISDIDIKKNVPVASLYAQTKDKEIVNLIKKNGETEKVGSNVYKYIGYDYNWETGERTPKEVYRFGYQDNVTGISAGSKLFGKCSEPISKSMVKGHSCYAYVSAAFILKVLDKTKDGNIYYVPIKTIVDLFEKAECYDEGSSKFVLKLTLKDKSVNFLQAIYEGGKKAFASMTSASAQNTCYDYEEDMLIVDSLDCVELED